MAYRITNSVFVTRPTDPALFTIHGDGSIDVNMDGYVIIPRERYGEPLRFGLPPLPDYPSSVPEPEEMLEWDAV